MKKLLLSLCLLLSVSAFADIEEGPGLEITPSTDELEASRSCFKQLEEHGCGHPKDDMEHFRKCLGVQTSSLEESCRKLMKELYH